MRMRSSFIVGAILSLSLQAKGIVFCPPPPTVMWVFFNKKNKERREREQTKQLNELIMQGKMVDITIGENEKLSPKMRLIASICLAVFLCTVGVSPLLFTHFLIRPLFEQEKKTKKS